MTNRLLAAAVAAVLTAAPAAASACACGCGVFDVGANSIPNPSETGLSLWFRYDYMDQNQNWELGGKAPASDNGDKRISTSFYTFGAQYMINHSWMVMGEIPVFARALTTTDDGTVAGPAGSVYTGHITDIGDMQMTVMYTGFSPDMSTGLGLGVKLPTGNYTGPTGPLGGSEFDRDSLPGTGSTDLMVSGYHFGRLTPDGRLSYFVQARYEFAVATRGGYRPGDELDSAVGVSYELGPVGRVNSITPTLQLVDSNRDKDSGPNSAAPNSGYQRLLIAPGVGVRLDRVHVFADVEVPIYQHVNAAEGAAAIDAGSSGQLTASILYKLRVAYDF